MLAIMIAKGTGEYFGVSDAVTIPFMLVGLLLLPVILSRWSAEVTRMVIDLQDEVIRCDDPSAVIPFGDLIAPVHISVLKGTTRSTVTIRFLDQRERERAYFLHCKSVPRGHFAAAGLPVQVEVYDPPMD